MRFLSIPLTVLAAGACLTMTTPAGATSTPVAAAAVDGYQLVVLPNANVQNFQRRTAVCPAGKRVIGGGAEAQGANAILVGSFPTEGGNGWIGIGRQTTGSTVGISVFAICANA
ncbi:hypothetical protein [Herbidospora mongoliensis]|uniref:hypothetical protein n=1 Tax=Herbidospora mongoliensis TaxID=688067 RepID=UPI000830A0CC|nr:hypothetical protein [Herbidospora mongoliensis]